MLPPIPTIRFYTAIIRSAGLLALAFALISAPELIAQSQPVFVTLMNTQIASGFTPTTATTTVISPPGSGWNYSAAAQVSGTVWNQLFQPNPKIQANATYGVVGSYVCNSANNIALTSATGGASGVQLTAVINIGGLDTGSTRVEPNTGTGANTALGPNGLMDQMFRLYLGTSSATYTFSGLTPGASFFLYCYGATNATTATGGCKFSLPAANTGSDDTSAKETSGGNSGNIFALTGTTYSLTASGTTWCQFHAVADSNGKIAITTSKNSSSNQYTNGFQLVPYPLPAIAAQPTFADGSTSKSVYTGAQVIMSASGTGSGTLSYQWFKDGVAIAGGTSATLTLSNVPLSAAGNYSVGISNFGGTVTSNSISLSVSVGTVNPVPVITSQPASQSVLSGTFCSLIVSATGNAMTYQWYKNGSAVAGGTSSSLGFASVHLADAGNYQVIISNDGGSATSSMATLTVLSANLQSPTLSPVNNAAGLCPDTPLSITFAGQPLLGGTGKITVFDAATNTAVDTIDVSTPTQVKTIGTLRNFNYYPVIITGTQAVIYLRNGVLSYNKTYYVTIDPGVFQDSSGVNGGISDSSSWRFSTKPFGPSSGASTLTVAADNSGDYCTVQAALDFVPANNTAPVTIFVRKGIYTEMIYFYGKSYVTILGEDRNQTVIAYANNALFNPAGGGYHRMVLAADHAPHFTIANLSIRNTTPLGGSQAEAMIMNGNNVNANTATNVSLYSHQDTLQVNGQGYIANSYIEGDVDFMWGQGPNFFYNCELKAVTSGGYYCQARNPVTTTNHGNVYLNCTFEGAEGVSGIYLARIDPAQYPYSEMVLLNCAVANDVIPAGWLLNNTVDQSAASAPTVRFWEYNSHDANGNPIDVSGRAAFSKQLTLANDAAIIANYSNPAYVLGNSWSPQLMPIIMSQPVSVTVAQGQPATLSVGVVAVPDPSFQWMRYGVAIPGATGSSYAIPAVSGSDAGSYTVAVSNAAGSVVSAPASVVMAGGPAVIAQQPISQSAMAGGNVSFSVLATGSGPFAYQWLKNGTPISGANSLSYSISQVAAGDAGNYSVTVSNPGGTVASNLAALSIAAPGIASAPPLPIIPAGTFSVLAYGALADGVTDNTAAIQNAINAARDAGGGTVELPPAALPYECGPITLYSNINFQIDGGAVLQALPFVTYPKSTTAPAHFITVNTSSSNVEISGGGTIDGNGLAWWNAFNAGYISGRPRLLLVNHTDTLLVQDVVFSNAPTMNLTFAATNNVTVYGVTVKAPGYSPNTDGIDPAGSHYLIQNCSVAVGDDNIALKPGGTPSTDINITQCSFGSGHGCSIGGQTNGGFDGITVTNCSFNGTNPGLRMKADPTQGGLVQNVTCSNITMTNVANPIVFYSYYNKTSALSSGTTQTITPSLVNSWNATPPNSLNSSTLPGWQNIAIHNLTATGASGYSIIWGLPLPGYLINNVTLDNVQITGGSGLQIYDATSVQMTGATSVGPYITCNALAITGQPQSATVAVGGTAAFSVTAAGTSGATSSAPTFRWYFNGVPVSDGTNANGAVFAGSSTSSLNVTNVTAGEAGAYTAVVSNSLDGYNLASNSLSANSIALSATSSAATLTLPDAFVSYVSSYGLDPSSNGAATADPDQDGICNKLEFFLGGDPTKPGLGILPVASYTSTNGSQALVFEFDRVKAAAGIPFTVEFATDLNGNWTAAVNGQNGITIVTVSVDSNTEHITVTIPFAGPRLFARLRL